MATEYFNKRISANSGETQSVYHSFIQGVRCCCFSSPSMIDRVVVVVVVFYSDFIVV